MNKGKVRLHYIGGEPGTGKSTYLLNLARKLDCDIVTITPTHASANRLRNELDRLIKSKNNFNEVNKWMSLKKKINVQHGYKDEPVVFIDEFGYLTETIFQSLLVDIHDSPHAYVDVYVFGDIKQLPAIRGISPLERLFRYNMQEWSVPFYEGVFTKLYGSLDEGDMAVPGKWKPFIQSIDYKILHDNYRLMNNDYKSFSFDFIYDLINKSIVNDDYSNDIIRLFKEDFIFLTPTHERGQIIDEVIFNELDNPNDMPFLRMGKEVYLNPKNKRFEDYKNIYPSLKSTYDAQINMRMLTYSAYLTVNYMQGSESNNVAYFLGNKEIPKSRRSHYSINNFYTAITRGRKQFQLVGDKNIFYEMLEIYPEEPQSYFLPSIKRDSYKAAAEGIILKKIDPYKAYEAYVDIFTNKLNETFNERFMLDMFNEDEYQKMFENSLGKIDKEQSVYTILKKMIANDTEAIALMDKRISELRRRPKRGKIKNLVASMTEEEKDAVRKDLDPKVLTKVQFHEKYGFHKHRIKDYL